MIDSSSVVKKSQNVTYLNQTKRGNQTLFYCKKNQLFMKINFGTSESKVLIRVLESVQLKRFQ